MVGNVASYTENEIISILEFFIDEGEYMQTLFKAKIRYTS